MLPPEVTVLPGSRRPFLTRGPSSCLVLVAADPPSIPASRAGRVLWPEMEGAISHSGAGVQG